MKIKNIEQEQLKNEYATELAKVWGNDQRMIDFCIKEAQRIVKLQDGRLFVIEKKPIETKFCYGYGLNGIADEEGEELAKENATIARTNEEYFIEQNMRGFSVFDYDLWKFNIPFVGQRYNTSDKIVYLSWRDAYSGKRFDYLYDLSKDDEQTLRNAYEEEKAVHLKKIQSYLKRFGLSKVRSWSYLID